MVVSALAAVACAPSRPARLLDNQAPLTAADYPAVLRTWTRSARLYQNLENKLFLTATFHAPELRRAFAVAFPDIYGHGGKITQRELVSLSGSGELSHNFLLSMYTPDLRWNDLSREDSIWHLTLSGSDEVVVSAEEVLPVKPDANIRAIYPYINRFDHLYLVRFPLGDARHRLVLDSTTQAMTLRIASALGNAELTWELDTGRRPHPTGAADAPSSLPPSAPAASPVAPAGPPL